MHLSLFSLILMTPLIIFTNASDVGISAVLMQTDSASKQHVTAFASRALTQAEKIIQLLRDSGRGLGNATFSFIIMVYKITVYTGHSPIT